MIEIFDPECSFYESAFKTGMSCEIRLSEYIAGVSGGTYKQAVEEIRRMRAIGKTDEADTRKRRLPLLTPGGVFRGGRKSSDLYRYSGLLVADIDDAPGDPADWLRRAAALPYVKAGHVSPSGTGLKLFVRTDASADRHPEAFSLMKAHLEHDLPGLRLDPSGKDVCRGCFVSYDPGAFCKVESGRLTLPPPYAGQGEEGSGGTDEATRVGRYLDEMERGQPFVRGGRHNFVLRASVACNKAGFSLGEVRKAMISRYQCQDFSEGEIDKTLRSGYQLSKDSAGVNERPVGGRRARRARVGFPGGGPGAGMDSGEGPDEGVNLPDESSLPLFPDTVYDALPDLLARVVAHYPKGCRRDMVLLSSVGVLSTCLPGVHTYTHRKKVYPHLFVFIEGASGSGKGVISPLRDLAERYAAYLYAESERRERASLEELENYNLLKFDRQRQKPSARKPLPPRPAREYVQRLFIPTHVSSGKLLLHLRVNGGIGGLMFSEEAETLTDASDQRYGKLMPFLRKVAMHEEVSNSFKTDDTYTRVTTPRMAMVLAGTLKQFISLLPSAESGMVGRMLFYHNESHPEWIPVSADTETPLEEALFRSLGDEVFEMALHLRAHPFVFHLTREQHDELNRVLSARMFSARVFGREEMEGIVRRCTIMLYRVAMILTALRHAAEGRVSDMEYCRADDFRSALSIVMVSLGHTEFLLDYLPEVADGIKRSVRPRHRLLLLALPDSFTRKEAHEVGVTLKMNSRRVNEALKKSEGIYVIKTEGDTFMKIMNPEAE